MVSQKWNKPLEIPQPPENEPSKVILLISFSLVFFEETFCILFFENIYWYRNEIFLRGYMTYNFIQSVDEIFDDMEQGQPRISVD